MPAGGISKLGTFASLFAGNHLNVAVLTDLHQGDKAKVRDLEKHEMLTANRVFTVPQFTGTTEADTEDLLGWEMYRKVVNACYGLKGEKKLPKKNPNGREAPSVQAVKEHFQTVANEGREFDHLSPAAFLLENANQFQNRSEIETALKNFESLFIALNGALSDQS